MSWTWTKFGCECATSGDSGIQVYVVRVNRTDGGYEIVETYYWPVTDGQAQRSWTALSQGLQLDLLPLILMS